jgi:hypothetical protein
VIFLWYEIEEFGQFSRILLVFFITKPLDIPELIGFVRQVLVDKELENM